MKKLHKYPVKFQEIPLENETEEPAENYNGFNNVDKICSKYGKNYSFFFKRFKLNFFLFFKAILTQTLKEN